MRRCLYIPENLFDRKVDAKNTAKTGCGGCSEGKGEDESEDKKAPIKEQDLRHVSWCLF
jgi:hypothetical protein